MIDNKDLSQRFDYLEERLDALAMNNAHSNSNAPSAQFDEIDLRELFMILWRDKWWIIGITFLFAMAGVYYALSLPNIYKAEGVYTPAQREGVSGGMTGQLGGLASLAGVSLGGGAGNDIDQSMTLITSWPFLEGVINKYDLKPIIMAVNGWNDQTGELTWDKEVYDPTDGKWLRKPSRGRGAEPSGFEAFKVLRKNLFASVDVKTGLVRISYDSYSPESSAKILDLIVFELNKHFQVRDVREARSRIEYLEKKISETRIAEMQAVFYSMVETQLKNLMLAEVSEAYVLKPVIERKVPEEKSGPKRALIVVFIAILGGVMSLIIVFARYFFR